MIRRLAFNAANAANAALLLVSVSSAAIAACNAIGGIGVPVLEQGEGGTPGSGAEGGTEDAPALPPDSTLDDGSPDGTLPSDDGGEDGAVGIDAGHPKSPDGSSPEASLPDAAACKGTNVCPDGTTRCESGGVETCAVQADGCTDWGPSVACTSGTCTQEDAGLAACCANECNGVCESLDTANGVFVSTSSSATSGCGAMSQPCGTIAAAIAMAPSLGKATPVIYLDKGTYAEQATLGPSMTLRGGWVYSGVWTKDCAATASSDAVIAPPAGGANVSVIANGVAATLDTLTVMSKATANAGESLYGVVVTNGASLTMTAVDVSVAAGGAGMAGGTGAVPAGPTPPCAASDGKAAAVAGTNGTPVAAAYATGGYAPGNGLPGNPGNPGDDGTAGSPSTSCGHPSQCFGTELCGDGGAPVCGGTGTPGCGGPGGSFGLGGGGGGASIALFVWDATVDVSGGTLTTAAGGNGGAGGAGVAAPSTWANVGGDAGATGYSGTCQITGSGVVHICSGGPSTAEPGGAAGGNGGQGSTGGSGASGSGGDSWGYYLGGGAAVNGTFPTPVFGAAGTSPGPVAAAAGNAGAHN